jgi:hypothetical protein
MSTIVPRLFPNPDTANQAVHGLLKVGFREGEIKVVTGGADEAGVAAAITSAGVLPKNAAAFAARLAKDGGAVVVANCRPLFTVKARKVFRRLNPIDVGVADPDFFDTAPEPTGIPKILRGTPATKLLDSDMSGNLASSDWTLMGGISNSDKEVKNLATDMQPFSKLSTDMKPWSNVKAGGPSLPLPTVIRDDE